MAKSGKLKGKAINIKGVAHPVYAKYGPLDGFPVIVFHGSPGSRLERVVSDSALHEFNISFIMMERPGYGLSDFQENRSLLDWPDDVTRLADSLRLERFSIMGFSGGGPYAAACAYKIPERLIHTALVSSAAPFTVPGLTDAMQPGNRALFELARDNYVNAAQQLTAAIDRPEALFELLAASVSQPDKAVLADAVFSSLYRANLAESLRQGMDGPAYDMALVAQPWEFNVIDINANVSVWHGELDSNTPLAMGQYLAETIPDCQKHILPGCGHFLTFAHEKEILCALTGMVN